MNKIRTSINYKKELKKNSGTEEYNNNNLDKLLAQRQNSFFAEDSGLVPHH